MGAFEAKYSGWCAQCDERIEAGSLARYIDDELSHDDCDALIPKPAVVCQTCWLEKPCPCEDGL